MTFGNIRTTNHKSPTRHVVHFSRNAFFLSMTNEVVVTRTSVTGSISSTLHTIQSRMIFRTHICLEGQSKNRRNVGTIRAIFAQRNTEARSHNHCYSGKAISITCYECMSVALGFGTQIASFLRRIILSSAACPALPYLLTLSHKRQDFREKNKHNK